MVKVRIVDDNFSAKIYIDGQEVSGVRGYSIEHDAWDVVRFRLDFNASEIELDGEGFLPELPDVYKPFYQQVKGVAYTADG